MVSIGDPLPALAFRDMCCETKLVSSIMLWKTKEKMMCSFQENKGTEGDSVIQQAKIHRHHFVPTSFQIPEKDNHEPFEELFYDTSEFDFLSHDPKLWIVGRHFLSSDRWMWKLKSDTKLEQHAFERLVFNERTFEAKASLEDFVKGTYPSLSPHLGAMRPYCTLRVNRYMKSSLEWVDVCSWKHDDDTFFYVVGTENAFPTTSLSSLPLDLPPAPSKFMAVVSKSFPFLLSMFSSFEVELAQNSPLISENFPTDILPTWDSEDEYYYEKRGSETDESDW